jgi:hypothetical protein
MYLSCNSQCTRSPETEAPRHSEKWRSNRRELYKRVKSREEVRIGMDPLRGMCQREESLV